MEIDRIGMVIGGFRIEALLGRGGMGTVYRGHELSLNRKVALKILSPHLCVDETFVNRFKREAQVVAAMNHPNIVGILSYGEDQGLYYFAMEYIRGKDLAQLLKEKGAIPLAETLSIADQVSSALTESASRGVVHRDLKPSNIMVDDRGRAKVTDFGIAHLQHADERLTQTGFFLGTPEYASPEQVAGQPLDIRSDIYSLGAVLYRMLTGKPPVTGDSPLAIVNKISTEPITPIDQVDPSLPRGVSDFINKMMAKTAAERFQTPEMVVTAIQRCIRERDTATDRTAIPAVDPTPSIPSKRSTGVIAAVVGATVVGLAFGWFIEKTFFSESTVARRSVHNPDRTSDPPPEPAADHPPGRISAVTVPTVPPDVSASVPAETSVIASEEGPPMVPPDASTVPAALPEPARARPRSAVASDETAPVKPAAAPVAKKSIPPLPRTPGVLMVLTGDAEMTAIMSACLASSIGGKGIRQVPVSEAPALAAIMHQGAASMDGAAFLRLIPRDKAQIVIIGQTLRTGSMNLLHHGQVQQLTTAVYSIRVVDMDTGLAVVPPANGSVKFTPLTVRENTARAIASAIPALGDQIQIYWEQKLSARKNSG